MSVTRKWSVTAAVLAVAMMAAGWFLLVSPKRSEAADIRQQTVAAEENNARLLQQLEMLKAQHAELPAQRAKLAAIRKQVPDNPALPTLVRTLTKAGRQVGVSIDSLAPAPPALMAPTVAAPPVAPATTETTETTETAASTESTDPAADTAATPAAPVAPAAPAGPPLYQVGVTLSVTGTYFELEQFIHKLEALQRSFLVSGFSLTPAGAEGSATSTEAATTGPGPDDLTLNLSGRVFMSPPVPAAPAAQPTPTTAPAQ